MLLVGLTLYWDRWLHPPAEQTNPSQLVTLAAFVCVSACMCFTKKKKNTGRQAVANMVDGSVLVLEYDDSHSPPLVCVCVCVCTRRVVCVLKIIHEDMPQYLLGKCGLAG